VFDFFNSSTLSYSLLFPSKKFESGEIQSQKMKKEFSLLSFLAPPEIIASVLLSYSKDSLISSRDRVFDAAWPIRSGFDDDFISFAYGWLGEKLYSFEHLFLVVTVLFIGNGVLFALPQSDGNGLACLAVDQERNLTKAFLGFSSRNNTVSIDLDTLIYPVGIALHYG
jgi:hypothetical protein